MSQVAVLGSGAMGSRVAQNLLRAHHQVVIFNRSADKVQPLINQGAIFASTPQEAAQQADIVISLVTDDPASQAVWLDPETGALQGLRPQAIAIESSTLTVEWTKELAKAIEKRGSAFLDAPVIGSRPQAEAGTLIYVVGGEEETVERVRTLLLSTGARVLRVGSTGQGMAMKLAVNALFGIQVAALAEILGMLANHGVSYTQALNCLSELPVTSPAAKAAGSLIGSNQHAPLFPIRLVEKDFRYILHTGQMVQAALPLSRVVGDQYRSALEQGWGDQNITGIVHQFRSVKPEFGLGSMR